MTTDNRAAADPEESRSITKTRGHRIRAALFWGVAALVLAPILVLIILFVLVWVVWGGITALPRRLLNSSTADRFALAAILLGIGTWAAWRWRNELGAKAFLSAWAPNIGTELVIFGLAILIVDRALRRQQQALNKPRLHQAMYVLGWDYFESLEEPMRDAYARVHPAENTPHGFRALADRWLEELLFDDHRQLNEADPLDLMKRAEEFATRAQRITHVGRSHAFKAVLRPPQPPEAHATEALEGALVLMPRLKYLKVAVPYTEEVVRAWMIRPAQDEQDAFHAWREWLHRIEDAPLPDFVAPEDARAYREYLRAHDRTQPPRGPLGAVLVIERGRRRQPASA
jgi:hypothetical protein